MVASSNSLEQLTGLVRSLNDQGILDNSFNNLVELGRHPKNSDYLYLSGIIETYIQEAERTIAEINDKLSEPEIDYDKVKMTAHRFKGTSMSLGGNRVILACQDLENACDNSDEEESFTSFEKIKKEFETLKDNLNRISDLAKAIAAGH